MLPKNEKQFHISLEGEISGERYEGDFTCVCVPTISVRNKISRDELREAGDLASAPIELFLRARWLSNCAARLLDWPQWWDGAQRGQGLLDDNVLKAVYDQCIEAEIEWRQNVKKKASVSEKAPETPPA